MNIRFNKAMINASIGFAAAFVLLIIAAFLLFQPTSAFFWISVLFLFFGYVAIYGTVMFYLSDERKTLKEFPANYPMIHVAVTYCIAQIVLVIIFVILNAVLENGVKIRYYAAFEIILLVVFAVRYALHNSNRKYVAGLEKTTEAKVMNIRIMVDKCSQVQQMTQDLPGEIRMEASRLVRTMEDRMRYSDPVTPESLAMMDYDIDRCIEEVAMEVQRLIAQPTQDLTLLRRKITEVNNLVDTRNNRVRMMK